MKRVIPLLLIALSLSLPGEDVIHARTAPQQKEIVIEAKNEPLASVLEKLEKASGFKMQYVNSDVYGIKVDKTIRSAKVADALDQILQGTKLTYVIDKQYVTIKKQTVTASAGQGDAFVMQGHVYDESGLDVPGVTVMIVGTDKGTATDVDGRFSLKVKAGEKLKFSYIGYADVVEVVKPVNNRKVMKVFIKPDSKSIDEVQVVAFGTQKKESVVSAITTVNCRLGYHHRQSW